MKSDYFNEKLNSLTHGIGAIMALAGMILLIVSVWRNYYDPWKIASSLVYGSTLVILFASSSLYHGFQGRTIKQLLQKVDHSAIYMLIAGTYTPVALVAIKGLWGWWLFGIIWTIALAGIILTVFFYSERFRLLAAILYLAMGWLVVFALGPLIRSVPLEGLLWLLGGGVFYSGGVAFYLWKKNPYNHVIWHLCVMAGAGLHFYAIYFHIMPL